MPAPSAPLMGHGHTWPHRHAFIQKSPLSKLYFFLAGVKSKLTEQWWLPLKSFKSSIQLFSQKHSWNQKLSEHKYLPGLQLQTFWTTHPPEPGTENQTRKSTAWCWIVEALKSPFPDRSTISSGRAMRSPICPSSKEKHGIVWSWCFKGKGPETSVCHTSYKESYKWLKLPKVSSSQPFLPSLFHPTSFHRSTVIMMEKFELKVSSA